PILSGVRSRFGKTATIIIVGILFGLFHMSIYRLIPTTVLGILISYIVLSTGSIYNGIVFHLVNNGTAVILEMLDNKLWLEEGIGEWYYYLIFTVLFITGIYLIRQENKVKEDERDLR